MSVRALRSYRVIDTRLVNGRLFRADPVQKRAVRRLQVATPIENRTRIRVAFPCISFASPGSKSSRLARTRPGLDDERTQSRSVLDAVDWNPIEFPVGANNIFRALDCPATGPVWGAVARTQTMRVRDVGTPWARGGVI